MAELPAPTALKGSIRKKLVRKLSAGAKRKMARAHWLDVANEGVPGIPVQAVLRAASFAARKHDLQTRADNRTPYFAHVARVALLLTHVFGCHDEDVIVAALLHDTLEDTATSHDEIAELFGQRVADYVAILTKNDNLPKRAREEDYFARLAQAPEPVMIAKMADLYDNLSARVHSPKFFKTAQTVAHLLEVFGVRLKTKAGRLAHAQLSALLREVRRMRPR